MTPVTGGGAPTSPAGGARARLADVRSWWHEAVPPPSLLRRLDRAYVIAITAAILGALVYGTASSALSHWITPSTVPAWGPSLALVCVLLAARWGGVQGPVVYSVADTAHVLQAPLPRRALALGRLLRGFALGALGGAALAAVTLVGLAGRGRGIAFADAAGLAAGAILCGVLAVAGAAAVEGSAGWDRLTRLGLWPVMAIAAALVVAARHGAPWRSVALWSGPWGWAIQPVAGVPAAQWGAALAALAAVTAVAAAAAARGCGAWPTERHILRAEARAGAMASAWSMDARTARLALRRVSGTAGTGRRRRLPLARRPALAVPWRDAVAALAAPRPLIEGIALAAGGAALLALVADRPAAAGAGALLAYAGAGRLIEPLRAEVDRPGRARILLRESFGRVLVGHVVVPAAVTTAAMAVAAVVCALAGAISPHGGAVILLTVVAAPVITLCAAMSARRGGRLPTSLLTGASAADPSGGGAVIAWLVAWPATAAVLGGGPAALAARVGGSIGSVGVAVLLVAAAILATVLGSTTPET